MTTSIALDKIFGAQAMFQLNATPSKSAAAAGNTPQAKARAQSQDFEAVYINSMFQHMFEGLEGEGPFGGSTGVGVWRSLLTDEYAKSFAKKGGVGIADQVYKTLLAQQENKSAQRTTPAEVTQ